MPLKTDLAEQVVTGYAVALRDSALSGADRAARLQDLVEKVLERYGRATAVSRGSVDQICRADQQLLNWICGDWEQRASRVHAELLLDPESGVKAAIRRAMAAAGEAAA